MAIIYSNIPLTKETQANTTLQLFITGKETFEIVDKSLETYENSYKIIRTLGFKKEKNLYQVNFLPLSSNDGLVVGLFIGEGIDFRMRNKKDPIFVYQKDKVDLELKGFFDKNKKINKLAAGMFFEGTELFFKKDGIPYRALLTNEGWNIKITESVSDVSKASKQMEQKINIEEVIKNAEEMMQSGELSKDLFKRFKIFILNQSNLPTLNFLTIEETKKLEEKGLL